MKRIRCGGTSVEVEEGENNVDSSNVRRIPTPTNAQAIEVGTARLPGSDTRHQPCIKLQMPNRLRPVISLKLCSF